MSGFFGLTMRGIYAWAAGAALLAVLAAVPWLPGHEPGRVIPRTAVATPATVPPLAPLSQYAATVERPLFSPSRRPPAVAPTAPRASSPFESRYRLIGVVILGDSERAIVTQGTQPIELAVGDRLEGWTVARITQSRVTLKSAEGEITLVIKTEGTEPGARK